MITPYKLLALIGKNVVHPGGGNSTKELYAFADLKETDIVLEVGCGTGTTAIDIVKKFNSEVVAIDFDPDMIDIAKKNIEKNAVVNKIKISLGNVEKLPFANNVFDKVIIESVISLTDRDKSIREIIRVCKKGGKIVDHEFIWKKKPTSKIEYIFEREFSPNTTFKDIEDWVYLYRKYGLKKIDFKQGPFSFMQPMNIIKDEGLLNIFRMLFKVLFKKDYLILSIKLLPNLIKLTPYLGYIVITGEK